MALRGGECRGGLRNQHGHCHRQACIDRSQAGYRGKLGVFVCGGCSLKVRTELLALLLLLAGSSGTTSTSSSSSSCEETFQPQQLSLFSFQLFFSPSSPPNAPLDHILCSR
ncbi:unnamed protein product [Pleuronectes platessa]|uniref:Uncharacterized protein n=1 Tax=Pleuronectes platessa TaxID=8262 RepID=A0A9N7UF83_PLEPL|nr:unnamed protein product [Pleuronectes platessa]